MSSNKRDALVDYVTSNGRVWPYRWAEFSKLIGLNKPGILPPLILGGSIESDAAKRQRLIDQIDHVADDPALLRRADEFLRALPEDGWCHAPEPLSDESKWPFRGSTFGWTSDPKDRPSDDLLREKFSALKRDWPLIARDLCEVTHPARFTGRKRRRLVVHVDSRECPPWGSWSKIERNAGAFRRLRSSVNEAIYPLHVDHIDFVEGSDFK